MLGPDTDSAVQPAGASSVDHCRLSDLLSHYATTRDAKAREEIIASTLWLATRGARLFADRGEPFDDLVQVARVGLLRAVDRFEPAYEVPFSAFATAMILGELRRHFRDHTWMMHVSRHAKDTSRAVSRAREDLARTLGRSPYVSEIATHLRISSRAVIEAIETHNAFRPKSLDASSGRRGQQPTLTFDDDGVLNREVVIRLLHRLGARERTAVYLRFFENKSQQEIATQIGTSQVHAGRLIASSLQELNRHLGGRDGLSEFNARRCG